MEQDRTLALASFEFEQALPDDSEGAASPPGISAAAAGVL
jgi:hypothetical protein